MNPPKTPKNIQSPQTTKRLLRKKEVDKTADTNIFPDEVYRKSYSQENPNTTAEGVKMGGTSRITPKVVPEKVLNPSPDTLRGDNEILKEVKDWVKKEKFAYGYYPTDKEELKDYPTKDNMIKKAISLTRKKYTGEGVKIYNARDLRIAREEGQKAEHSRILEMIDELIKKRRKSILFGVNDYEEIFSINDLNSIKKEIMKDET